MILKRIQMIYGLQNQKIYTNKDILPCNSQSGNEITTHQNPCKKIDVKSRIIKTTISRCIQWQCEDAKLQNCLDSMLIKKVLPAIHNHNQVMPSHQTPARNRSEIKNYKDNKWM